MAKSHEITLEDLTEFFPDEPTSAHQLSLGIRKLLNSSKSPKEKLDMIYIFCDAIIDDRESMKLQRNL